MADTTAAKRRCDDFAAGTGTGVWTNLHRATVAQEVRARVDNPALINQGQVGVCGPASFLKDLITDDPELYVRMAQELFDTGATHMVRGPGKQGGRWLRPDKDLRTYAIPFDKGGKTLLIPEADWLMLASLRQSLDWVFNIHKAAPDEGGTTPSEMVKLFKDAGYTDVDDATNDVFHAGVGKAKTASEQWGKGYRIVLSIDANLLVPLCDYAKRVIDKPTHFVQLTSAMTLDANNVAFNIWTWQRTVNVPVPNPTKAANAAKVDAAGKMALDTFLHYFYGYVQAKY